MKWLAMIIGVIAIPYVALAVGVICGVEWRRRSQARREQQSQQQQGAELADGMLHGEPAGTPVTYCPECAKASVLGGHVGMPPFGAPVVCCAHSRVALTSETLIRRVPVQQRETDLYAQQDAYDVWQRVTASVYRTPTGLELEREWFWVDPVDPLWN